jgi:DNA polymerase-1
MKKPLLVLVDGSAVFHRGYHAIPHLSTKDGVPTNAVFGFATILLKVLQDLKPKYVVVAWDKGDETTFRKQKYPDYKATRKKQPDDLYAQIPTTRELVGVLNLPWIELGGYEADDIIGTLAAAAEKRGGLETVIVTGDLDELQLVDASTRVYTMKRGFTDTVIYDLPAVKERYGVTPAQFVDLKALKGDTSDNIPGVPGIGEKSAMELIAKYGSLDGVYEHLDELKPAQKAKLEAGKDLAYLSQDLSRIDLEVPVKLELDSAEVGHHDRVRLHEMLRQLEFKSLLSRLPVELAAGDAPANGQVAMFGGEEGIKKQRAHLAAVKYRAITSMEELGNLVAELEKQEVFAFDTETTDVDTLKAKLVGISVSWREGEAHYIPVGHSDGFQLDCQEVVDKLRPVFENRRIGKVGHNLKFDYQVLKRYGVELRPVQFDTMVAAFLLNSRGRAQSLDDLAYSELGIEMIPIEDLIGKGKAQVSFDKALIEEATTYACEDADMAWRLYEQMRAQLAEHAVANEWGWSMERLATEIEWPIVPVLAQMELRGIELDSQFLHQAGKRMGKQIGELKEQIYHLAGEEFNLSSPAQLGQILYGRLGLSTVGVKKGKTGHSTAAGELEKMRELHPIIELIMKFRELDKLKNTYVDALPGQVAEDGRVHTSFSQVIVPSGRLSSSGPNLMNIPVRTSLGREIRTAFVAPEGRVLVSGDYSQIELRVAAALSGDEAMIETFRQGVDLHARTAAEIFEVPLDKVTKDQRAAAKTINFGVLYGMSAHGLSVATGFAGQQAQDFIDRYFELRPKLREYIEGLKVFAREHEYIETIFGRRFPCPEIKSNNFQIRSATERVVVNIPLQGAAADIYKLAMIEVAAKLDKGSRLLLQIHDELIVETAAKEGKAVAKLLQDTMSGVIELGVPLVVDTAVGKNWGEL